MCWTSNSNKLSIADKDIPVFKIVIKDKRKIIPYYFSSPVYGHYNLFKKAKVYRRNRTFHSDIRITRNTFDKYICDVALHSYSSILTIDKTHYDSIWIMCNGVFVASYYFHTQLLRMNCVIPKGSQYAINEKGEYLSDKIKVLSFEEIKNKK